FAAIAKLPPGGRLVLEGEVQHVDRYWDLGPLLEAPTLPLSFDDAVTTLRGHLERAVDAMLLGDGPVGVFLSGGLDSTARAALPRKSGDGQTFALGFDVAGSDERSHATHVARTLGTRHRTITITPGSFLDGALALAPLLDEPLADPALVPTFLLARLAR